MGTDTREFIINELIESGFIEHKAKEIILEELEDTGKSELKVWLVSEDNLCIANTDRKKTDLQFFQKEAAKSLYKRVDHMIFEHQGQELWKLHLIEMKGSVGERKWPEIKGKFRASYLVAQAIAGMLGLHISETVMYTAFEKVRFAPPGTMPSARRTGTGRMLVKMEDEWNGKRFGLNFGKRLPFVHIPVRMTRDEAGKLVGSLTEEKAADAGGFA